MIENTAHIKAVFDALPLNCVLVNADAPLYTVLTYTAAFEKGAGMPKEALEGNSFLQIFMPDNDDVQHQLSALLQSVSAHTAEQRFLLRHATNTAAGLAPFSNCNTVIAKPVCHEDGGLMYILITLITDVDNVMDTASSTGENDIASTYDLFQQAPVAICIVQGPEYIVKLANEAMLEFLGRTTAMLGKPIIHSLPEARLQGLIHILDTVRQTGKPYTVAQFPALIFIDGVKTQRYFDLVFKPYFKHAADALPDSIFCVAHNVTKQILDQKKIEESEEKYRSVFEAMDQGFCIMELMFDEQNKPVDYRFLELNPVFEAQTGLKDAEGKTARQLVPELEQHWFDLYGNVALTGESIRFIEGSAAMGRWFEVYAFKMGGENSRKVALLFTNITERKHTEERLEEKVRERTIELENLNKELKRSNVNLEEFAYAASHDLKEPIRKIHFFSDRIKSSLGNKMSEEEKRTFERMEAASKRMSSLIDDLLSYSQISIRPQHYEEVDMNALMDLVLEDLDLEIEDKGAVVTVDKLFTFKGHHRQLQQAFHNLVGNALKYTKQGVVPEINISYTKVSGKESAINLLPVEAEKIYYLISVKDNGIGFEQSDAERIFNVFTRLHGMMEYRGTGVGLSIVRKVIENHDGHIWAESKPGEGAAFKILLPAE